MRRSSRSPRSLGRRRRPRPRQPSWRARRRPGSGRASGGPAPAWSRTLCLPGCPPPRSGPASGPRLRQVKLPVDHGVPGPGCISEIDRDLGVFGAPGSTCVLALNAGRGGALLQVTGLIDDQDRIAVTEVFGDVVPQVIADAVGVPACPAQQVLHPAGRGITSMLRDGPAVLAGQIRQ